MRIRYSYSAKLDEVDDRVKMHLEDFKNNKPSIDWHLSEIIEEFKKKKVDHSKALSMIEEIRLLMGELDILLEETSGIVSVCSDQGKKKDTPDTEPSQIETHPQVRVNPLEGVNGVMNQITDMANTLHELGSK